MDAAAGSVGSLSETVGLTEVPLSGKLGKTSTPAPQGGSQK